MNLYKLHANPEQLLYYKTMHYYGNIPINKLIEAMKIKTLKDMLMVDNEWDEPEQGHPYWDENDPDDENMQDYPQQEVRFKKLLMIFLRTRPELKPLIRQFLARRGTFKEMVNFAVDIDGSRNIDYELKMIGNWGYPQWDESSWEKYSNAFGVDLEELYNQYVEQYGVPPRRWTEAE